MRRRPGNLFALTAENQKDALMLDASNSNRTTRSLRTTLATLVLACGVAAGLAGCDDDQNQRAIDAASVRLDAFGAAGSAAFPREKFRKDTYTEVISGLKSVAESGTPGQRAAANLLIARGHAGMGEIAAQNAAELERRFLSQLTVVRAALDQWVSQNSVADALKVYDPTKDLADLDKQIAARLAEAEALQTEKAKQVQVVDAIKTKADQASAQAKQERTREAQIRASAEGQSQTGRLDILTRANEARRAADKFDEQAAIFLAEAAKEAPRLDELQREIDRLKTQSDLLRTAKSEIQARHAKSLEQSGVARDEAQGAAAKIKAALAELETTRNALTGPRQEAVRAFTQAAAAAKKAASEAQRETKNAAQSAGLNYQQALGDLQSTQAFSASLLSATLQMILNAKPPVPETSGLGAERDRAKQEFETARTESESAYKAALALFASSGVKADDERVKKIEARLRALANEKPEPAAEPAAEPAPAGDAGAPAADKPMDPGPSAGVEAEVRAALAAMEPDFKSGDFAKALTHIEFTDPQVKAAIESALPLATKGKDFNAAATEKFGKGVVDLIKESQSPAIKNNPILAQFAPMLSGGGGMGASLPGAGEMAKFLSPEAKVNVVSDKEAELSVDGVAEGMTLVKVADAWKIRFDAGPSGGAQLAGVTSMLQPVVGVLDKVTTSIREGKYANADAMLLDLNAQLMGAMGGMMGGGNTPGGRPKPPAPADAPKPADPAPEPPAGGGGDAGGGGGG